MKGKSPAFQFYASDFYMDTISWSNEMVGLHIRLLCQQWVNGTIIITNLSEQEKEIFDKIKHKFFEEKNGNFLNKKLEKIQKERKEFLKKCSKGGTEAALKRWGKHKVPYKTLNKDFMLLQSSTSSSSSKELVIDNTWENAKKFFLNDFRWIEKFCSDKVVKQDELKRQMLEFLKDLSLSNQVKPLAELQSHFLHSFNKKKFHKTTTDDQPNRLNEKIRSDLRKAAASGEGG